MKFVIPLSILLIVCCGCGTGPWFIAKKNYEIYTKPVVQKEGSGQKLLTTGTYSHITTPENSWWRTSLMFEADGDVLKLDSIDGPHGTQVGITQGWYTIMGDSLIIEYFAPHRRQMYAMVYWEAGRIVTDSTLRSAFTDQPTQMREYRFNEGAVVTSQEEPMYLHRKWYQERLHKTRSTAIK